MTTQITHSDGIPLIPEHSHDSGSPRTTLNGNIKIKALPANFYNKFLSEKGKQQKPSPIRGLYPLEKKPGVISLLAGKPEPSTFPFTSLSFTVKDPLQTDGSESTITIPQDQLSPGLQYSDTAGIPDLLKWITTLQEIAHGRKHGMNASGAGEEGWRVSMGSGSQDLISKSATALIDPGDCILVESPVYAGVIPIFKHMDCKQIEVPTDSQGIRSSSLKEILENWPEGEKKPKLLYTVPYGCNPTGMTASLERRKEVLKLARQYDFIILEDDPYYYLYYGKATRPSSYFALEATEPCGEESGEPYAEVGRVLRFDSLSKILSAGLRIGFATGPETILRVVDMLTANANLQVSSLTQLIAFRLLDSWGYDKFFVHTKNVSAFYEKKRDVFENGLKKWLGGGIPEEGERDEGRLAEWVSPEAGMFFWFKLLVDPPSTDSSQNEDEQDSRTLIETHAYANGVLALPGTVFLPNGSKTPYVRASFSLLTEEQVVEAMKRLRKTVLEVRSERANR
ncbi:PLP-dependent transferase [Lentinula raphanica]|uniref:PLP-dependent transferase n=1 Tax=Lentinula raphanica TaxID=153919 RepID=A0AA38UE04_9AGAR|nr:PLP-dependent transferase [Lentinula raphanica]KAJ3970978.1 PLP-dependent transferase [Lentinula raphanica]